MTLFILLGCSKLATIEVAEKSRVTVEGSSLFEDLLGQLGFDDFVTMDITAAEELRNQGVGPDDIHEVHLLSMELEAVDPPDGDLAFFEEITFYMNADDLDEERLAFAGDFPEGQALVDFQVDDLDLAPYVISQAMTISTDVTAKRPEETTVVEARFVLAVDVTTTGVRNYYAAE